MCYGLHAKLQLFNSSRHKAQVSLGVAAVEPPLLKKPSRVTEIILSVPQITNQDIYFYAAFIGPPII